MREKNIRKLIQVSMIFFVFGAVGSILIMKMDNLPTQFMMESRVEGLLFLMGGIHLFICVIGMISEIIFWRTLKTENDGVKKAVTIGEIMIHGCVCLEYLLLYEWIVPVFCAIFYGIYIICMVSYLRNGIPSRNHTQHI